MKTKREERKIEWMSKEKIRTGQSFLYREHGYESMVIEIKLREKIDGFSLMRAYEKALHRFHYLTASFFEEKGDFFLIQNDTPLTVRRGQDFRPLGGKETNGHLIDVHYWEQTLYISYHHGLSDGKGMMPFVRTFLAYYFAFAQNKVSQLTRVAREENGYLAGELAEPANILFEDRWAHQLPTIQKAAYSLPEANEHTERLPYSYKKDVQIETRSFMEYVKSVKGTPAAVVAALFSEAIAKANLEADREQTIKCNLVIDLRPGIQLEATHRNCVTSLPLPYEEGENLTQVERMQRYRQQIKEFKETDNLKKELRKITRLNEQLDSFSTYGQKKEALRFFETLLSDTYILSYIGQLDLGELEDEIEEFHTYTSGNRGLTIEMLATKQAFFLDVLQSFSSEKYINQFCELLKEQGIAYHQTAQRVFSVPRDQLRAYKNE